MMPKKTTWERMSQALGDLKQAREAQDEVLQRINALVDGTMANIEELHVKLTENSVLLSVDSDQEDLWTRHFSLSHRQARGLAGWVARHLGNVKVEDAPNGVPEAEAPSPEPAAAASEPNLPVPSGS